MVVLVVEDEAIIAYCSAAMLEDAGYAVLGPAHTSAEALELARGKRPDVALIDIDLECRARDQRRASAAPRNSDRLHDRAGRCGARTRTSPSPLVSRRSRQIWRASFSRRVLRPRAASRATPSRSASFTGFPAAQRIRRVSEPGDPRTLRQPSHLFAVGAVDEHRVEAAIGSHHAAPHDVRLAETAATGS